MSAIVTSPISINHLTGIGHPECPERYTAIYNALLQNNLLTKQNSFLPQEITTDTLLLCHTPEYVELVEREVKALLPGQLRLLSTGDVVISPDSFTAALHAVGAAIQGVDLVAMGKFPTSFVLVRPPGHHACKDRGMGFCLFNNIAIAARYAQKTYGIKRVLIVDWDLHHGNGTQDIFDDDPSVFYFSTHQAGIYPGTGRSTDTGVGKAQGTKLNCPITAGPQSREEIFRAFTEELLPKMETFKPELILISAGFDAHRDDPLGQLALTEEDFAELTQIVKTIAHTYAKDRIISVLEGGYNLTAIANSAVAHVRELRL